MNICVVFDILLFSKIANTLKALGFPMFSYIFNHIYRTIPNYTKQSRPLSQHPISNWVKFHNPLGEGGILTPLILLYQLLRYFRKFRQFLYTIYFHYFFCFRSSFFQFILRIKHLMPINILAHIIKWLYIYISIF